MIHNPVDRCAKLLRELRSFDPRVLDPAKLTTPGLTKRAFYALYMEAPKPPYEYVLVVAKKYERCLLAAVWQLRRIRKRRQAARLKAKGV